MGVPPKPDKKPSVKMRQFNWQKIPNTQVADSFWAQLSDDSVPLDIAELELLFGAKEIVKKGLSSHAPVCAF